MSKTTRIELDLTEQEIAQLRHVMDWLPLGRFAPLICAVTAKLPVIESDVAHAHDADADSRALNPPGPASGFSLKAFTPEGQAGMERVERMLGRLRFES